MSKLGFINRIRNQIPTPISQILTTESYTLNPISQTFSQPPYPKSHILYWLKAEYLIMNFRQHWDCYSLNILTMKLKNVKGISFLDDIKNIKHNYAYFPIFVDEKKYGLKRDELYKKLKKHNIYGRRYFYPLISSFSTYKGLDSAKPENLPVAEKIAEQVVCLPIYPELKISQIKEIIKYIKYE